MHIHFFTHSSAIHLCIVSSPLGNLLVLLRYSTTSACSSRSEKVPNYHQLTLLRFKSLSAGASSTPHPTLLIRVSIKTCHLADKFDIRSFPPADVELISGNLSQQQPRVVELPSLKFIHLRQIFELFFFFQSG